MSKNRLLVAICSLMLIVVSGIECYAGDGYAGRGNMVSGGGSGTGGSGATHGVYWFHYNFLDGNGTEGQDIYIQPQWNANNKPWISEKCASKDVGFWILANATDGGYRVTGDPVGKVSTWYKNEVANTAAGPNNAINDMFYINLKAGSNTRSWNGTMYYPAYAPYNTLSFNNASGIKYTDSDGQIPLAQQRLYKKVGSEYKPIYENDRVAKNENEILEAFRNFLIRTNTASSGKTNDEIRNMSTAKIKGLMADTDNPVYAFCSYDTDLSTKLESKTKITVSGSNSSDGSISKTSDNWNSDGTNNDILVLRGSDSIEISAEYLPKRDDVTFATSAIEDGVSSSFTISPSVSGLPTGKAYKLSAFSIGVGNEDSLIAWQSGNFGTLSANNLTRNTVYTVCAITSLPETLTFDGTNTIPSESKAKSSACVKVKYEPYVAAIDSKTTLTAYGILKEESDPDKDGELDLGSVPYGAGAISATWSYNLSSSSRCIESNFDGTRCSSNNSSIKSSFNVNYKRSGAVYDDSNYDDQSVALSYSDYSSSDGAIVANTKTYNLLPGEQLTQKQGISHYAGVRTDGTPATDTKESSSMTLKATAEDAICGLNNLPFGLGNPVNYGRMTVVKNKNRTGRRAYEYGDNLVDGNSAWSDAGDIWLKPTDTVQLSYEACMGEQIQKDKDSGNKEWDGSIPTEYNAVLTVGTSNDTLDDTHYEGIGGAVDADSIDNKNIVANEKIGDTIKDHISNNYQFVGQGNAAYSDDGVIEHLGQTITNDFGNISSDIHATMKIPYNYILEPEISAGTKEIVTLGNENTFTISVKNPEVRINTKVQNDAYQTDVKPGTKATYLKFAAKTDTSASVLASLNGEFISGDKTGDIASTLSGIDFKNPSGGNITIPRSGKVDEETVKVSADESDSEYNKLCVAVAVYPADSHNLGGKPEIEEKDDQSAALTDSINGGYTRIAVACKTVGKYPTTSVEGNGIVAGGNVTGAYTEYNNRYFGSWTEYSLIANSVQNFASGASVAYTNPQTTINAMAAWDLGGLNKEYFDSLQTLGNMSDDVGLRDEAEASLRVAQMQSFVDDVKSTFFAGTPDGSGIIESPNDNKTFINTNFDGDVVIGTELANDINDKANEGMVLIYSQGDIKISNQVQSLNAVLIADGIVDTCFEKDQGGDNGQLLDNCYNPLVINGVVFSNKDIALDRVYGGGSTDGMNLDSNTLIQRAEIFNFNPEIVEWGYNYKHKTQPITTTYIEELSTRY